jgi:hypothetical protein
MRNIGFAIGGMIGTAVKAAIVLAVIELFHRWGVLTAVSFSIGGG